jgi:hypothetical protein
VHGLNTTEEVYAAAFALLVKIDNAFTYKNTGTAHIYLWGKGIGSIIYHYFEFNFDY